MPERLNRARMRHLRDNTRLVPRDVAEQSRGETMFSVTANVMKV